MWRKPEDTKPAAPAAGVPASTPAQTQAPAVRVDPVVRSLAGMTAEVVQPSGGTITSTLVIKGEIRGNEDLYIDGEVQGTIHLTSGRVTVGPHGKISANVEAREIVVRGKVLGALRGRDRVEVASTGEVRGDISTKQISIAEGAQLHSKVEITREEAAGNIRSAVKPAVAVTPSAPGLAMKAVADSGH